MLEEEPDARPEADGVQGRAAASVLEEDLCEVTQTLIHTRQNISSRHLVEPAPSAQQLLQLLDAAAAAPDHGLLNPWRFVLIPQDKRVLLAEVFAQALIDRDSSATPEQIELAREKAHRAPLLLLAVAQLGPAEPAIPPLERMVSLGCAIQNMLLLAHAMGFGAGLTGGQAMNSPPMRTLFALTEGEQAVCFVNMGTVSKGKSPRTRPGSHEFISSL